MLVAEYNQGAPYANGTGVPEDLTQACMWLDLATA